jgi:hypothetical protein
MRSRERYAGLVTVVLVLAAACAGGRGAAERAIAEADSAIAAVEPEASKVAPDQLKTLQDAVASGRASLEANDYEAAVAAVQDVPARAQELAAQVPAKRAELTASWDTLNAAMARNLDSVDARLDRAGRTRRYPPGLNAAAVDSLKQVIASARQQRAEAETMAQTGDLAQALAKGLEIKGRVSQAMAAVGMVSDERAWGNLRVITP